MLNTNKGGDSNGQCKYHILGENIIIIISYLFQSIGKKYYVRKSEMMREKLQSEWDKTLVIRGYYMKTIGNITNEAI